MLGYFGAILILVSVAFAFMARIYFRRISAMAATPTLTCTEVAELMTPARVELVGQTAPGPSGMLRSPSGEACVAHQVRRQEDAGKLRRRDGTSYDGLSGSPEPFVLVDDTGEILIHPEGTRGDLNWWLQKSQEEWVLPAGQTIYVLGEAVPGRGIRKPAKGPYIISTQGEAMMTRTSRVVARVFAWVAVVMLAIGLLLFGLWFI